MHQKETKKKKPSLLVNELKFSRNLKVGLTYLDFLLCTTEIIVFDSVLKLYRPNLLPKQMLGH